MSREPIFLARLALGGLVGLLAVGCGSPSTSSTSTTTSQPSPTTSASTSTTPMSPSPASPTAPTVAFKPIVEPFDPGHPAHERSGGKDCESKDTTVDIELCYEIAVENTDVAIDAAQTSAYAQATTQSQALINADDARWLKQRGPICAAFYNSGGTIDGVNIASCLLDESTARLDSVRGTKRPPAQLKASDDATMRGGIQFYTAGDGTRIAATHSQGDQHGGAVIDWIIIGGYRGFAINASDFTFVDGQFTDRGVAQTSAQTSAQSSAPTTARSAHRVDLSIDYTNLANDPNASKNSGRFVYAPSATIAASWR